MEEKLEVVSNTQKNIDSRINAAMNFDLNIEDYANEIKILLEECNELKKQENKASATLHKLYDDYSSLHSQKIILQKSLNEISKDFKFAEDKLPDKVECPVCHAIHQNSFAPRFELAVDEIRCCELLQKVEKELENNLKNKQKTESIIKNLQEKNGKIQSILKVKKGNLEFVDVIKAEGRKEIKSAINEEIAQIRTELFGMIEKLNNCEEELKRLTNRDKIKKITQAFFNRMQKYFKELKLWAQLDDYNKLLPTFKESGSDKTRVLLAYYYTVINEIANNSTSTFCPIVIDSPKQADIDKDNWNTMLKFILQNLPSDSQCILGLVEHSDISFPGRTVLLTEKYKMLQENTFATVYDVIMPLLSQDMETSEQLSLF
jgi:uncharacterized coiled-coil DUF342 family protein